MELSRQRDIRKSLSSNPAWLLALVGVVIAIGTLSDRTPGTSLILVLIGWNALILFYAIQRGSKLSKKLGYLNPATILFGFLAVSYVARPIYNLATDKVGTPTIGYVQVSQIGYLSGYFIMSMAVTLFTIGFFFVPVQWWLREDRRFARTRLHANSKFRLLLVGAVSGAAFTLVARQLLRYSHGLFAALTIRQVTQAGLSSLIYISIAYKVAFLIYYATYLDSGRKMRPLTFLIWWSPSFAIDLFLGDRAQILVGNILIFGCLAIVARHPERTMNARRMRRIIVLVMVSLFLFVGYRVVVRGGDVSNREGVVQAFETLPNFVFGSGEVSGLDYFLSERNLVPSVFAYRSPGQSFEAVALASVPSEFVNKPLRSAQLLTEEMYPNQYKNGSNITFTGAGDLYDTFGDIGVVFGYLFIGLLSGWLVRGPLTMLFSFQRVAFAFYLGWLVFPILRTDLSPIGTLPISLIVLGLDYFVMTSRSRLHIERLTE